jgi:hypothetical protein
VDMLEEQLVSEYEGQEIDMAESVRRWKERQAADMGMSPTQFEAYLDLCEAEWTGSDGSPKVSV